MSSSASSQKCRSLRCRSTKAMKPTLDNELIAVPYCFCGIEASLKISWTDRNPGRRFFNCANGDFGCEFFRWHDHYPGRWFNVTLTSLLTKISELERLVDHDVVESNMEVQNPNNMEVRNPGNMEVPNPGYMEVQNPGYQQNPLRAEKCPMVSFHFVIGLLICLGVLLICQL